MELGGLIFIAITIWHLADKIKESSLIIANAILEKKVEKFEDEAKQ